MTISSSVRVAGPYTGTGSVSIYPFAFKVFQAGDVLVKQTDLSGNVTTLALTTDYSVTLSSDQNANPGGSISLNSPLPNGYQLVISSQVQELQGTSLTNNGGFYPNVIENALDYLTILVQQAQTAINASLQVPLGGTAYDAGTKRIANLADGQNPTDASTVEQMQAYVNGAVAGVVGGYGFFQAVGTGAVARTFQSKLRDSVSITDFGADPTGTTDSTAAIQAALNVSQSVYIPQGTYKFSSLTLPYRGTKLYGCGLLSVLVHTGAGVAITCADSSSTIAGTTRAAYVQDGQFTLEDFTLYTNGTIGISPANTRSTGFVARRLYMMPTAYQNGFPGSVYKNQTAISCNNTAWTGSVATYQGRIEHCVFTGYQNAIALDQTVNFWEVQNCFTLDCLNAINLAATTGSAQGVTGIAIMDSYFQSGVAAARGIVFGAGGGNEISLANTGIELTNTAGTQYAYDFSAGGAWVQVTISNIKYLIQSDGNAINNRRITGTAPSGLVEINRSYTSSLYGGEPMLWAPGVTQYTPFQLPGVARFGGFQQGSGTILLGRNDTETADSTLWQDAFGNLNLQGYHSVVLQVGQTARALTFTAAPASGATSATLSANWAAATGTYNVVFSDGEVRPVTLTNGATTATWSTGLTNAVTTAANAFGVAGTVAWSLTSAGALQPNTDNAYPFGNASNRPTQLYAASSTINTSDVNEKEQIAALDDAEFRVAKRIKSGIRKYKFRDAVAKKGDQARIHVGLIAQDVHDAFVAEGLDPAAYGMFCSDTWEENGVSKTRLGLRYDELMAFMMTTLG